MPDMSSSGAPTQPDSCARPATVSARDERASLLPREVYETLSTCARLRGIAATHLEDEVPRLAIPPILGHGLPPAWQDTDAGAELFTADRLLVVAGDGARARARLLAPAAAELPVPTSELPTPFGWE